MLFLCLFLYSCIYFQLPYAGVKVLEGVGVEQVLTEESRVSEVVTTAGNIKCEYFVNAAGLVRGDSFLFFQISCINIYFLVLIVKI